MKELKMTWEDRNKFFDDLDKEFFSRPDKNLISKELKKINDEYDTEMLNIYSKVSEWGEIYDDLDDDGQKHIEMIKSKDSKVYGITEYDYEFDDIQDFCDNIKNIIDL